nr:MAG TPA: hypothetical protein [Caudoviricetes sp.]
MRFRAVRIVRSGVQPRRPLPASPFPAGCFVRWEKGS